MCRIFPLVVLLMVHLALPACTEQPSDGEATSTPAAESNTQHEAYEPGAESPRALLERLYVGIAEGDGEKVASVFDPTDPASIVAGEFTRTMIGMFVLGQRLEQAAHEKFGPEGVKVLREELGYDDRKGKDFAGFKKHETVNKAGEAAAKAEIVQEGDRAVALNGDPLRMRRRNGRWYAIQEDKKKAVTAVMMRSMFGSVVVEREGALKAVESSQSLDELRQHLQEDKKEADLQDLREAAAQQLEAMKDRVEPGDPAPAEAGAASPREAFVTYVNALDKGDADQARSVLDVSHVSGQLESQLVQTVADQKARTEAVQEMAREKFGEEGAAIVANDKDQKEDDEDGGADDAENLPIAQEGDLAAAVVPGKGTWSFVRKGDDRWYLRPDKAFVAGLLLTSQLIQEHLKDQARQMRTAVEESTSLDELRSSIEAIRGRNDSAKESETLEEIEVEADEEAPPVIVE